MPVKYFLHNNWILKPANQSVLPGQIEIPDKGISAKVPGTVHTDLLNARLIDNPFYADNERHLRWIDDIDWIYEVWFDKPSKLENDKSLLLVFEGLDTIADIYLNDQHLDHTENMFRRYIYDISAITRQKQNHLWIFFKSARIHALDHQRPIEQFPSARHPERVFVRKAQYSFGWDWGPAFPTTGIWRPVYLIGNDQARIDSVRFSTLTIRDHEAEIQVIINLEGQKLPQGQLKICLYDKGNIFTEIPKFASDQYYRMIIPCPIRPYLIRIFPFLP